MSKSFNCIAFVSALNRYASAPQELRTDWNKFTKDYFLNRSTLVSVFLLIDASIPAKKIDLEYASWLGQNQVDSSFLLEWEKEYINWWPAAPLAFEYAFCWRCMCNYSYIFSFP